ncbi:hypothetical protein U1839_26370 [Sphingomonas sp. RT2P30]|uniref:hypothetical protein n=1 Tax=Parasphingomonas halimpatiens TaxID=3096162 RepID=UPI002FC962FE
MERPISTSVYVTAPERAAFEAYAQQFLLDPAGLLALLFAREMRVGRLRELIEKDVVPSGSRKPKITARLQASDHIQVRALAQEHNKSLSEAGAVLVRAELNEKWLHQALTTRFESRSDE